ncbi:helix-turn-helix domain-containing protein [Paenibacillus thalictri]|uniref:Helix-turn-helix domain-containing protein n=1 Tax=Paenibacillus thalictri TaxID=2527873 RepID=A0A4Q9E0Q5_9BACL|nr:helix-turn-helix domain-containing protein [Paenibacillus thalictri]TBL81723.1 helix-turn-helix domain-containing protein [Paenibacillus thalictri]
MQVIKNKLFQKILMYFLSLLIPIIIIGLTSYLNEDQIVKNDVSQKLAANLKFSSRTVDIYLEMAQSTNNNLFLSDIVQQHLKPYSQLTDAEKVNLPLIVRAIVQNRNTISSFIDHIFLYIDTDRVYSSEGLFNFNTFFDQFYSLNDYNKDYWKQRLGSSSFFELLRPTKVEQFYGSHGQMVIPSVSTQYVNGKLATMVTSLSVPAISSSLNNNSLYPSTSYFIMDSKRKVILNSGKWDEESLGHVSGLFPGAQNIQLAKLNNTEVLIVHAPSGSFGWDYYSVTPVSAFSGESSGILNVVFWICLSLVIIGILFSFLFSVNLYNPIKNIKDVLIREEKEIEVHNELRSGDEFKMIRSRIHQLVEQNRNAALTLNQYSSELLDQFFTNLIKAHPWVQQEIPTRILGKLGFDGSYYSCCCFMFDYKNRFFHELSEGDRLLIQEKMKNVLWGLMQRHVSCYVLELDPNLYVCIMNLKQEEERQQLNQALDNIKSTFEYDMIYCELKIGLGKIYSKIGDIAKSYSDAITAIVQGTGHSDVTIADAADFVIEQTYFYSFLDENKIANGFKTGNMETLRTEVEGLVQFNMNRGVSYVYLGALLAELMNTGIRYIHERQIPLHTLLTEDQYAILASRNMSPGEFRERIERLLKFYERIVAETTVKSEPKAGAVITLITGYIENHYAENIYLEHIADEIGLSPKYVSRLFKETTGTSITDYISLVRMAKAKELLAETDLKISEVSERIGILSRTTFLRIFKKYEGISPMDYRTSIARKQNEAK